MKLIKRKSESIFDKDTIAKISNKFNLYPEIIELLFMRNINDENKIQQYLHPSANDLYDPFLLNDMDKVVEKVRDAINNGKKILVFGDYDVDGVSATAILIKYFNDKGVSAQHFMPNRYIDGYGLSCEAIDKIKDNYSPDLIITVDCGISCHDEVEYAKSLGIDVIVTDHHDIPDILPNCLTLNAKLPNQKYPFREICGTGMAFKLVQALEGLDYAKKYLPIVAIATIADIVPLLDENRAMVTLGLQNMKEAPKGIRKLLNKLDIKHPQATDISYKLAPKLNASGRLGDADKSFELYMTEDDARIEELIDIILELNAQRQELCNTVYDDCKKILNNTVLTDQRAICLYSDAWDSGILGIVAARLCEEYYRPTFLFSNVDGLLTGSGRSIEGVNIHSCLKKTQDILESFGGHTMAAGLKLKVENFEQFKNNIETILQNDFSADLFVPQKTYDMDLDINKITKDFVKQLDILEPIGNENPRPRFRIKFARANATLMKQYPNHLTMNLHNISAVGFNFGKYKDLMNSINTKKAIVELQLDVYRGHESSKMFLKQVIADKKIDIADKDKVLGEYFAEILCDNNEPNYKKIKMYDEQNIINVVQNFDKVFGTLFIANTIESYDRFCTASFITDKVTAYNYKTIFEDKGHNVFILNPSLKNNFKNFDNIVFLDPVLNMKYLSTLQNMTNANIYVPQHTVDYEQFTEKLSFERTICGIYYKSISKAINQNSQFEDLNNLFTQIKSHIPNSNYLQMIFCLKIFKDINIFDYIFKDNKLTLIENKNVHSNLENSKTYNLLREHQNKKILTNNR